MEFKESLLEKGKIKKTIISTSVAITKMEKIFKISTLCRGLEVSNVLMTCYSTTRNHYPPNLLQIVWVQASYFTAF